MTCTTCTHTNQCSGSRKDCERLMLGEAERLRRENAAIKEIALELAGDKSLEEYERLKEKICSVAPTDYHNPVDVETLKLAREALVTLREPRYFNKVDDRSCDAFDEALAEINKVIGGKEDA